MPRRMRMYPGRATTSGTSFALSGKNATLSKSSPNGHVTFAWDASTDPETVGYRLYYGTATGVYTASIDVGNVTTYTITGLAINDGGGSPITYYGATYALNADGDLLGDLSNEASGPAVP